MAAILATVNERILALMEKSAATRDRSLITDSDKTQAGSMQFDTGYLSPYFITDPERMEVAFETFISSFTKGNSIPRKTSFRCWSRLRKTGRPLLIIAEDVGSEVLAALVVNKLCRPLQVAAVRASGWVFRARVCCRILQSSPVAKSSPKISTSS